MKWKWMLIVLMTTSVLWGQEGQVGHKMDRSEKMEKFRSMKIAHLTTTLDLTPEQAEKFWPIYNKYEAKRKEDRKEWMKPKPMEQMDEAEAEELIKKAQEAERKRLSENERMMEELKGVLSASQRVRLMNAEHDFHRKFVNKIERRRRGGPQAPPPPRTQEEN